MGHRKYEADSGTIHEKVKFCRIAYDNIRTVEDLSEEAKVICEKLYNFVKGVNDGNLFKPASQVEETLAEEMS